MAGEAWSSKTMTEGYLNDLVYFRHSEIKDVRPTLIFIHGLLGSSSAWQPYEARFGMDYNLLFLDLRGHGKSVKKNDSKYYSLDLIATDIRDLARTFGVDEFVLIGHSFGALLALVFANRYSDMVSKLILLAPDYHISQTSGAKIVRLFLGLARFMVLIPFREREGIHVDYSKFFNTGDWDIKRIYTDIRNTSLRVFCCCLWQADKIDREKMITDINMPVLIVHGKMDSIIPCSDVALMAKKILNAQLKILPQANHILVINNLIEVSDEIENFIK
ncbi:MAG: alpha/beta hydrolase [Methanotrichaceae archaeon]